MSSIIPQTAIYSPNSVAQKRVIDFGRASAFLATCFLAVCLVMTFAPSLRNQIVAGVMAGFWLIAAPLWFWYEYFFLYREHGEPDSFELFKHGQQISAAIWAGFAACLVAFAASDYSKPVAMYYHCAAIKSELQGKEAQQPPPAKAMSLFCDALP